MDGLKYNNSWKQICEIQNYWFITVNFVKYKSNEKYDLYSRCCPIEVPYDGYSEESIDQYNIILSVMLIITFVIREGDTEPLHI